MAAPAKAGAGAGISISGETAAVPGPEAAWETIGPLIIKPKDTARAGQRSVCVLNCGGTIGMKANASGALEPAPGYIAKRMSEMAEFKRPEMPSVHLYELLPLLDSSDMG